MTDISERAPRFRPRLLGACLGGAVAAGVVLGLVLHVAFRSSAPVTAPPLPALHGQATWAAGRRPAPPVALRDQNGRLVSLAAQRGRTVLVAFMSTRCGRPCAGEALLLEAAVRQLPVSARPALLVVAAGPADTAVRARAVARSWGIAGDWHWLLGNRSALAAVRAAFGVGPDGDDAVYLVDRRGDERAGFTVPFLPPFLADDLRTLGR